LRSSERTARPRNADVGYADAHDALFTRHGNTRSHNAGCGMKPQECRESGNPSQAKPCSVNTIWLDTSLGDEIVDPGRRVGHGVGGYALAVIFGFAIGCGLGATCEAALGLWSLALPTGLAMLALAMGFAAEPGGGGRS
jgi:hypothetical protein